MDITLERSVPHSQPIISKSLWRLRAPAMLVLSRSNGFNTGVARYTPQNTVVLTTGTAPKWISEEPPCAENQNTTSSCQPAWTLLHTDGPFIWVIELVFYWNPGRNVTMSFWDCVRSGLSQPQDPAMAGGFRRFDKLRGSFLWGVGD